MTKWVHRLSDVDGETATCAACGPVRIGWKTVRAGVRAPRCAVALEAQRNRPSPMEPHGLRRDEAREWLQGKTCEICGTDRNLVVDHCHRQGKIRGALCRKCNVGLGMYDDDPERMLRAVAYLRRNS